MTWNRSLANLLVFVLATPAWAQAHRPANRGVQGGGMHGGQIHSGQGQHQGTIHPQQQMENDFWQHQIMLNEMMATRRQARRQTQTQGMQRQSPSAGDAHPNGVQPQSGSTQSQPGMYQRSKSHGTNQAQATPTPSSGLTDHPSNRANGKSAKQEAAASREARHEKGGEMRKAHARESGVVNKATRAADTRTAALLRNVHTNLEKADTDYLGHRVKAMHHIAAAINHLGATSVVSTALDYGGGSVPQAQSDRILDDAIFQLHRIEGSLGTQSGSAAHHGHARTAVSEAVSELETARRIR